MTTPTREELLDQARAKRAEAVRNVGLADAAAKLGDLGLANHYRMIADRLTLDAISLEAKARER